MFIIRLLIYIIELFFQFQFQLLISISMFIIEYLFIIIRLLILNVINVTG